MIEIFISDLIYPDQVNPLIIKNPHKEIGEQTLIFKFSLSAASLGLSYGQVIGVDFPEYPQIEELFFDEYETFFQCYLKDSSGYEYTLSPVKSDGNSFVCQYNEINRNLGASQKYNFKIAIGNKIKLASYHKISCLNLFTATSGLIDRIYIDSNPCFADMALYPNYIKSVPDLQISELIIPSNIQIYSNIDIKVILKANADIIFDGKSILFKLPNSLGYPTFTNSTDIDYKIGVLSPSISILKGELIIDKVLSDKSFFIGGIDKNIIIKKDSYIQILLGNINVGDVSLINEKLEVFLYYRNSYSIVSYDKKNQITVNPISINIEAIGHPDKLDVFKDTVSPLRIDFNISNTNINRGYVLIKHENVDLLASKFNFIASTCDFSRTNLFSQNLGERPICFPYTNNLGIDADSPEIGSGIVFKLPPINYISQSLLSISLTVFGFNQICGISNLAKDWKNKSKFSFSIKIFKNIDMSKFNEKRFSNSDIIAKSVNNFEMENTCYSNTNNLSDLTYTTPDSLLLADISDFRFISNFNNNSQSRNILLNTPNIESIDDNLYTNGYITNPENKNLITNSYLTLITKFPEMHNNNKKFIEFLAIPTDDFSNYSKYIEGRMKINFSKNFLQNGDKNCYFSWRAAGIQNPDQTNLIIKTTDLISETQKNYIISDESKSNGWDNNMSNVLIGDEQTGRFPLQIVSRVENGSNFLFISDGIKNPADNNYVLLNTNCYKFQNNFKYKSIYDYFEMSINFFNKENNIVRVNRFFKFMGNAGLMDENQSFNGEVIFHSFTNTYDENFPNNYIFYNNGICMIEIKADKIKNSFRSYSNKLIINISNLLLLDIDYTELSTTYPNSNNLISYANPSFLISPGEKNSEKIITNTIKLSDKQDYKFGNHDSIFQILGSSLIFDIDSSNVNTLDDILIPTFCPVFQLNNFNNELYTPTLSIYWVTMSDYVNVKINSVLKNNQSNYFQMDIDDSYLKTNILNMGTFPIFTSLRFNPYFTQDDNKIYILPNAITSDNKNSLSQGGYSCTAFSLLINEKIRVTNDKSAELKLFNTVPAYLYQGDFSKGQIFYNGISFKSMLFAKTDTEYTMSYFKKDSALSDAIYITGVLRPLVSDFYDYLNKAYNYFNLLAFQCTSSGNMSTGSNYFSNYDFFNTLEETEIKSKYFILDSNNDLSTWSITKIDSDKPNDPIYKNDLGGNIRLTLKTPNKIDLPDSYNIRIESQYFTSNTICGINHNNSVPIKTFLCKLTYISDKNSYYSECLNPAFSQDVSICCYNVNTNLDSFAFPDITVFYNPPEIITNYKDYESTYISTIKGNSVRKYSTGNSNGQDLLSSSQSGNKFNGISYSYATQEQAFGKASISIVLAREIVRGSKIIINGDLSKLQIHPKLKPKCSVVVSGFTDFVDSCSVDLPTGNVITIGFKKNIYSCGIILPKIFIVYIWPVSLFTYTTAVSPQFSITMANNDYRMLVNSNNKATLNFSGTALTDKVQYFQEDLCKIDIFPFLPGEVADYFFTFDLSINGQKIPSSTILNEVLIYFPYQKFYSKITILEVLKCRFSNSDRKNFVDTNCSLLDENLILVSFPSDLDLKLGNPQIQIIGIPNSYNNENLYFGCSINSFNASTKKRTQIINGLGKLNKKLIDLDDSKTEGLDLFELSTENSNPSESGKIILKFRFDSLISLKPNKLPKNTIFITYIPEEYDTKFYDSYSRVKGQISEVFYDESRIMQKSNYIIKSQEFLGNRLLLEFDVEIKLKENFSHFEIYLEGLINPVQPLETTGRFRIIITNIFSEFIYKTFTNTGSIANSLILKPDDDFLKLTKGINYFYAQKKWLLYLFSNEYTDLKKNLYLKKGRFVKYILRTNIDNQYDNSLDHSSSQISLEDKIVSTEFSFYEFSTAKGYIDIYFGLPCSAVLPSAGNYYLNINNSNLINFYKLNPFILIIDNKPSTISFPYLIIDTVRSGMQFIEFTLSDPTFSDFSINFDEAEEGKNDSTAKLDKITFRRMETSKTSVFRISNKIATGIQNFVMMNPNTCYSTPYKTIQINVNAESNEIPAKFNFEKSLTFANSDMDSSLKRNSIKITFTPPVAPLFLYCSLVCFNREFSDEKDLINPGVNYNNNDPLIQYNSRFIPVNFGTFDLIFNNLIRGMLYKLKCITTTTQSRDPEGTDIIRNSTVELEVIKKYRKRLFVNTNFFFDKDFVYEKNLNGMEKLYDASDIFPTTNEVSFEMVDSQIKVPDNIPTHCFRFGSNKDLTDFQKEKILNYCQRQFMNYLGCIICVDNKDRKMIGLEFSKINTCFANKKPIEEAKKTRVLQQKDLSEYIYSDYFLNNGNLKSPFYYTVCTVQDKMCDVDIDYPLKYPEIIAKMVNNLKDFSTAQKILDELYLMYNSLDVLYDKTPINISFLKNITEIKANKSNYNLTINNYYNRDVKEVIYEIDLKCYWKVDNTINPPFYLYIVNCNETFTCGSLIIHNIPVVITKIATNITQELEVDTYNVWFVCFNNFQNPTKPSSVISLINFTIIPSSRLLEEENKLENSQKETNKKESNLNENKNPRKEMKFFHDQNTENKFEIPSNIEIVNIFSDEK